MKIIKENLDLMKSVVIMDKGCGHKDYYGCMVMRDGINYCRQCIYEIWEREGMEAAKHREDTQAARLGYEPNYDHLHYWRPDPKKDFIFPLYEDGKDYFTSYNKSENTEEVE